MSTAVDKTLPDEIIKDLGGCGRYQFRLCITVHLVKTMFSFSFANLIIITSVPAWRCNDNVNNGTFLEPAWKQTCSTINGTECHSFSFEKETNTIVSEFKLICRNDFIPSTINSIQMAGAMASNVISGHIADRFGRKPIFLISILFVLSSCLVGFFSVSLEMFAVLAFFTGFGYGGFFTTHYNLMSEYTPARWRGFVIGFPSFPLHQCLLSLIAWRIREWRYLLLMTSILGMPCFLAAYLIVPESFRWYIAHEKFDKAKYIITSIAKFNRNYDFNTAIDLRRPDSPTKLRYSLLNLFQTRTLVKVTLLLTLNWITLGVVVFGLLFGIQNLSGNLYLNTFLFSLTTIPSKAIATWLSHRIGRRKATSICFIVVGIAGLTGGVLQTLDVKYKDQFTTVLAIMANSSTAAAWGTVQTMTVELYPTVIRNIGFGMLSFIGGIGSVMGPQFVYLSCEDGYVCKEDNAEVPVKRCYYNSDQVYQCKNGSLATECDCNVECSDGLDEALCSCTEYGQEFVNIPGYAISFHDIGRLTETTVEACMEYCLKVPECVSFQINIYKQCWLNSITPAEQKEFFIIDNRFILFVKK